MSGIIAVYGLVVSVLIAGGRKWLLVCHALRAFRSTLFPPIPLGTGTQWTHLRIILSILGLCTSVQGSHVAVQD
jgi:hypothetical protein